MSVTTAKRITKYATTTKIHDSLLSTYLVEYVIIEDENKTPWPDPGGKLDLWAVQQAGQPVNTEIISFVSHTANEGPVKILYKCLFPVMYS